MATASKKTEPSAEEKARAEAANAQPTEDTTRAGGHILTDRGWVIEHPQALDEVEETESA
jgi:hypothetical protein